MIVKNYEIKKLNLNDYQFFLLYGKNEGLKNEILSELVLKNNSNKETKKIDEKLILENKDEFLNDILSGSLFTNGKIIIIKHVSDKILNIVEDILEKNLNEIILILDTETLEKKSKLRNFFEKDKNLICVPVYPDNDQVLSNFTQTFFLEKKIPIAQSNINFIVSKCHGDREYLKNELNKIELFMNKKKNISTEELIKLTNLIENHSISDLIDSCLIQNNRKIMHILNENNFSNDDSMIILRTFLTKTKKILKLANNYFQNNDIDKTISQAKPPIFWKEKEIVKMQLKKWKPFMLKKLVVTINKIELEIKKNPQASLYILMNLIWDQTKKIA